MPERRLTCTKCGGRFDSQFVWGASLTAVRLGSSRYMRCPLCQKWSLFRLLGPETAVPSGPPLSGAVTYGELAPSGIAPEAPAPTPLRDTAPAPARRYSDVKVTALGGGVLGAIAAAIIILSYLLSWTEPGLAIAITGTAAVAVVAAVFFVFLRIREHPRPSA